MNPDTRDYLFVEEELPSLVDGFIKRRVDVPHTHTVRAFVCPFCHYADSLAYITRVRMKLQFECTQCMQVADIDTLRSKVGRNTIVG